MTSSSFYLFFLFDNAEVFQFLFTPQHSGSSTDCLLTDMHCYCQACQGRSTPPHINSLSRSYSSSSTYAKCYIKQHSLHSKKQTNKRHLLILLIFTLKGQTGHRGENVLIGFISFLHGQILAVSFNVPSNLCLCQHVISFFECLFL